ncbi:MAG: PLD nuclease N-terminal domain-containing protein, partial [Stackebrandtia sp.]
MGRIMVFVFLAHLGLAVAAIADCLGGEEAPRRYNRPVWVAAIVALPIAGPAAWFLAGRHRPQRGRPSPRPGVAPDDDPDFLRDLE